MKILINWIVYWTITNISSGAHISAVQRLKHDKTAAYDKYLVPVNNQSKAIVVSVTFHVGGIVAMEEVSEKFSVVGIMQMSWTDELMTWNPTDYDNIDMLMLPADQVWHPTLAIVNAIEKIELVSNDWDQIRYFPNGTAMYITGDIMTAKCPMDTSYYPWDTQKCNFYFSALGYLPNEVVLLSSRPDAMQTHFTENGQWALSSTRAFHGFSKEFSVFGLEFILERKPAFLIVNILLPIIFMSVLNIFVFAVPAESGERVSYAVTVLLSLAVFLTLVGDNLPKTSNPMSILSYYLLTVLVLSVLICFFTILNLHIYFKDDVVPVPLCIQRITRCCLWLKVKKSRAQRISRSHDQYDVYITSGRHRMNTCDLPWSVKWRDVSIASDKVCFLVFLLAMVVVTIIYMVSISSRIEVVSNEHVGINDKDITWF